MMIAFGVRLVSEEEADEANYEAFAYLVPMIATALIISLAYIGVLFPFVEILSRLPDRKQ